MLKQLIPKTIEIKKHEQPQAEVLISLNQWRNSNPKQETAFVNQRLLLALS